MRWNGNPYDCDGGSPDGRTGSERWMHAQSGLSVEGLVASARGALAGACLTG